MGHVHEALENALESGTRLGGALHVGYSRGGKKRPSGEPPGRGGLASSELCERGRDTA